MCTWQACEICVVICSAQATHIHLSSCTSLENILTNCIDHKGQRGAACVDFIYNILLTHDGVGRVKFFFEVRSENSASGFNFFLLFSRVLTNKDFGGQIMLTCTSL